MNRIASTFKKGPAYVAYLTAGDGGLTHSLHSILALIEGGVNIIEIGVPFSDPVADGKVIQQASQRALHEGITLTQVFSLVTALRLQQAEIPVILFSYYNPILKYSGDFYADAAKAGIDGCLIVDLPLEEANTHLKLAKQHHLQPIFLIAPSTTEARIKQISQQGQGMLYYVCRNGTTGVKSSLPEDFANKMQAIKQNTSLPVVTGFGISNKEMAQEALQFADGFVIGSLFVEQAAKTRHYSELTQLAKSLDPR